jgi:hypothetical protein
LRRLVAQRRRQIEAAAERAQAGQHSAGVSGAHGIGHEFGGARAGGDIHAR